MSKPILVILFCIGIIASCKCNNAKNSAEDNKASTENTQSGNNMGMLTETDKSPATNIDNDANALVEANTFYIDNDKSKALQQKKASARHSKLTAGSFPEGSERKLDENDIQFLTDWGHKIILNEIYARHGMVFTDAYLKNHFEKQPWYHPAKGDVYKRLSSIEKQNIAFLINKNKAIAHQ